MTSQQTTATPSEFAQKFQDLIAQANRAGLAVSYEGVERGCSCCMPSEVEVFVYPQDDWSARVFIAKLVY